jgi:hypothetical protein
MTEKNVRNSLTGILVAFVLVVILFFVLMPMSSGMAL